MDKTDIHPDWVLIEALGGPAKVAERLGWAKDGGLQRIQNWKRRGVPAPVKVEHPELFLPDRLWRNRSDDGVQAESVAGAGAPQPGPVQAAATHQHHAAAS